MEEVERQQRRKKVDRRKKAARTSPRSLCASVTETPTHPPAFRLNAYALQHAEINSERRASMRHMRLHKWEQVGEVGDERQRRVCVCVCVLCVCVCV